MLSLREHGSTDEEDLSDRYMALFHYAIKTQEVLKGYKCKGIKVVEENDPMYPNLGINIPVTHWIQLWSAADNFFLSIMWNEIPVCFKNNYTKIGCHWLQT